ncbi:MAG TPA: Coenzyme F420 hydrogenase/dehydrogenase, beta subunit C-terminal domain [Candidatus Acidoferrales bacterium]|nr:Coenzyme F420 hydrogenase/dehydrogenase, beta subunit C-terminal domain [Candidatus Acidoferrales bacterium]
MLEKPKLFGNLLTQVIRKNQCSFCGACMAACPVNVLWPEGEQPTLTGACALCEICYYQCPQVEFSQNDVEMYLHNRTRRPDEPIGITRGVFVGRATKPEIQTRAQDGGVVTALLAYALESGLIDSAVVAGRDSAWHAKPDVATKYEDLVRNAGTKYTPSPTILGVRSAIYEYAKNKVGVVGTPCQIRAVRRIQTSPLGNRRLAQAMTLVIGLFCMESYGYDKLVESYVQSKGIDPLTITRMAIKKGSFIVMKGEEELLHVPLKEVDTFVRNSCRQCDDFTAEFADISVGAIGSPSGRSTVIARTEKGLELLKSAEKAGYLELRELKPEEKGYQTVLKMAQLKLKRKPINPAEAAAPVEAAPPLA